MRQVAPVTSIAPLPALTSYELGWPPAREHDLTALTLAELERVQHELAASLALARPGSPVGVPIQAQLTAIDAELARRVATRPDESPRFRKP